MGVLTSSLGHKLRLESYRGRSLRSYDPRSRRTRLRAPMSVQIQTIDRCNGSCVMCPYSSTLRSGPANLMDDGLFRRVLEEIRRAGTVRTVLLMLQNEPFLDRTFPDRVRLAREVLGRNIRLTTVTNGSPLTEAMAQSLAASGIDQVSVSIDAVREDTFRKVRHGLDFRQVVDSTLTLIDRLGPRRVSARFLRQRDNEGEEAEFASYWRRRGVRVLFTEPTNRAGCLESYESVRKKRPDPWQRVLYPVLNRLIPVCPLPFTSMNVLWDGRVITCCNDWGPHDTVGDLSTQTLADVWNGEKINHYRHLLWSHRAAESLVCAGCSLSERFWAT